MHSVCICTGGCVHVHRLEHRPVPFSLRGDARQHKEGRVFHQFHAEIQ